MPTHEDDFSSGVGAQDDTPDVSFFVFLETKHAYTQAKRNKKKWKLSAAREK